MEGTYVVLILSIKQHLSIELEPAMLSHRKLNGFRVYDLEVSFIYVTLKLLSHMLYLDKFV